jgi:hypothetical protein
LNSAKSAAAKIGSAFLYIFSRGASGQVGPKSATARRPFAEALHSILAFHQNQMDVKSWLQSICGIFTYTCVEFVDGRKNRGGTFCGQAVS